MVSWVLFSLVIIKFCCLRIFCAFNVSASFTKEKPQQSLQPLGFSIQTKTNLYLSQKGRGKRDKYSCFNEGKTYLLCLISYRSFNQLTLISKHQLSVKTIQQYNTIGSNLTG